jgi:hypothetical protein
MLKHQTLTERLAWPFRRCISEIYLFEGLGKKPASGAGRTRGAGYGCRPSTDPLSRDNKTPMAHPFGGKGGVSPPSGTEPAGRPRHSRDNSRSLPRTSHPHWEVPWESLHPLRGAPTAGNRGTAVLSSDLAAGRGIRPRCGASCPFGSLDRGGCGLVVGDDPPWCPRTASIPLGRLPAPAPPPLAVGGSMDCGCPSAAASLPL